MLGDPQTGRYPRENSLSLLKGLGIASFWGILVGWTEGVNGFLFGCL